METAGPVLLVGATALHLGFQLVVTALVYPVLLANGAAHDDGGDGRAQDRWSRAHELHRRRITPVVGLVYGLLALACAAVLVSGLPAGWRGAAALASVAAVVVVVVVTATTAGPAHGRLASSGRSEALVRRLRRADAVRLAGAAVAAVAAVLAAV
ncbi:hypothetical protein [Quadrisphaera setariae]|uniref:hypothetical protein n=1 Tax=Quadrisphaera setariae TaxID=2593304 RepID=UPI001C9CE9D3|nr:hypothetical protein [Quadrisphaera setariae]